MRMTRFAATSGVLFFCLCLLTAFPAVADQASRAADFINKMGSSAISILADKGATTEEAGKRFRAMLHENFDLNLLGKFALGPSTWKALNPQQQQEYLRLFEQLVVEIYSDRFKTYNGETFKVGQARVESATDSYVTSFINHPDGGAPTEVDWRVREGSPHPRVIDVIVEGVSMSVTKRSEFAAAIQQGGGDFNVFLDLLRQKVNAEVQENGAPATEK